MYFNEKEDTNIDKEFKNNKKNSLFSGISKKTLLLIGGILLLLIIGIIIFYAINNRSDKYFIELYGGTVINMYVGDNFVEPGFYAYDRKGNDMTSSVTVDDSDVDTSEAGEYYISYRVGNKTIYRTINVINVEKYSAIIELKGEKTMHLSVGSKYVEPGYTAVDNTGADINSKVKVSGSVNTSKVDIYKISYSIYDGDALVTEVIRTVIVE